MTDPKVLHTWANVMRAALAKAVTHADDTRRDPAACAVVADALYEALGLLALIAGAHKETAGNVRAMAGHAQERADAVRVLCADAEAPRA